MTQLFPILFLGRTPWQRGHLGGIRLSKRSFTCAYLSAHSISSTTYPSKVYKALIFMVFTHRQSHLSSGLSLLTVMRSAWRAIFILTGTRAPCRCRVLSHSCGDLIDRLDTKLHLHLGVCDDGGFWVGTDKGMEA